MALGLVRLESEASFAQRAYASLRAALFEMNIYERADQDLRLDERDLAERLGVSRTPIRDALARLEHEGIVESIPRRGYFIVRKNREELVEIIKIWAALESMAARLLTERASDEEIASLRAIFATFENGQLAAKLDEYSDANLAFHARIIELARSATLSKMADALMIHVRSIRHRTISEDHRFERSMVDHMHIIEALETRNAKLAERLVRDHALGLAAHVAEHVHDI
ncbi:MAG TPA: GntR family transcriptional regulator [Candidatus Acidoferrales bacterium]|nr:GntR family transcriptional regulator [Candidatus Acidoferrales bacterium]